LTEIKYPLINDNIWYSNRRRLKSIWKAFSMDDTGKLKVYKKRIKYVGKKNKLDISNIKRVYMEKQTINYGTHVISFIICLACIYFTFQILVYSLEFFLLFLAIISVLYPVSLFGVKANWIGVDYTENGQRTTAYFSDGSFLGWERSINSATSLFERMKLMVNEENDMDDVEDG
jgi:hypothetical protein